MIAISAVIGPNAQIYWFVTSHQASIALALLGEKRQLRALALKLNNSWARAGGPDVQVNRKRQHKRYRVKSRCLFVLSSFSLSAHLYAQARGHEVTYPLPWPYPVRACFFGKRSSGLIE